jgi:glutathione S-transferase
MKHQCAGANKRVTQGELAHVAALHRMWNGIYLAAGPSPPGPEHASKMRRTLLPEIGEVKDSEKRSGSIFLCVSRGNRDFDKSRRVRPAWDAKKGIKWRKMNLVLFFPRRTLTMTITITAFERSPDGGKGLARDTRIRWALEEVRQPYEVRLVSFRAMKEPAHLALHPFGQIPTYEEGDLALFETGAIVFHIAERYAGLLPNDPNARARAITWIFAALSTVEPPILEFANARLLESDKPWSKERLPLVADRIRSPLKRLSARLGDADWLDGAFSAGDLMMVSVLLRLKLSGIVDEYPNLSAYVARGEARPAYKRAFDAQLAVNKPTG